MSVLSDRHFHDEAAAYRFVEARIWPNGAVCPHCGGTDRNSKLKGDSTRIGTYKCYDCRKPFTVKVGTIFEASHVKMHLWLQAIFLIASSKKGISSNQLHRTLGVTLKTAWFMSHRIREAMREGNLGPLGGNGKVVEADEAYYGKATDQSPSKARKGRPLLKRKPGTSNKRAILGLVERGGSVRTFHVIQGQPDQRGVSGHCERCPRKQALHRRKPPLYPHGRSLRCTRHHQACCWRIRPVRRRRRDPTRTPLRTISACSSVACAAPTSTAQRSICTAILRSSISAIIAAPLTV
jgi:transposase-like protein